MVILTNLPTSLAWQITLFTLQDCRPYVLKQYSRLPSVFASYDRREDIKRAKDDAEVSLIVNYQPVLNQIASYISHPLPEAIITEPDNAQEALYVLRTLQTGKKAVLPKTAYLREQMDGEVNKFGL